MKIAVNTRLLLKDKLEGIGWFTHESLRRIVQQHPEHQFYFLFDRPYDEQFVYASNVTPVVAHPPARHPYLWYLFFECGIPARLRSIRPDLFLSTDGWMPLHLRNTKSVNVIHDLNFAHHRRNIPATTSTTHTACLSTESMWCITAATTISVPSRRRSSRPCATAMPAAAAISFSSD